MPLSVQVVRNGAPLQLGWTWTTLDSIVQALEAEGKSLNDYGYALQVDHGSWLKAGDVIKAWR